MSTKKILFLLFVFLFPLTLVFLFQFFSEGVYEVAPLYEEGVGNVPMDCPYDYSNKPYLLPDSIVGEGMGEKPLLTLFYFGSEHKTDRLNLARIREQLDVHPVTIKEMPPSPDLYFLKRCVFLAGEDSSAVLADATGRIRGYYGNSLEETDRLIVEMKIILNID